MTHTQATDRIKDVIIYFNSVVKDNGGHAPSKCFISIGDLPMTDIVKLYNTLSGDKQLYLPKDLDDDRMRIIYRPKYMCVIEILSLPVLDYRKSISLTNKNWN